MNFPPLFEGSSTHKAHQQYTKGYMFFMTSLPIFYVQEVVKWNSKKQPVIVAVESIWVGQSVIIAHTAISFFMYAPAAKTDFPNAGSAASP